MFIKTNVINTNRIKNFFNYINVNLNYEDYCKKTIAEGKQPVDINRYKILYISIPMNGFNYAELSYIKEKIDNIFDEESKLVVASVIKRSEEELQRLTEAYTAGNLETFLANNKSRCDSYITRLGQNSAYRKDETEKVELTDAGKQVVELATKMNLEFLDEMEGLASEFDAQSVSANKKR